MVVQIDLHGTVAQFTQTRKVVRVAHLSDGPDYLPLYIGDVMSAEQGIPRRMCMRKRVEGGGRCVAVQGDIEFNMVGIPKKLGSISGPVLVKRQPSNHPDSVQLKSAYPIDGDCISLSPESSQPPTSCGWPR